MRVEGEGERGFVDFVDTNDFVGDLEHVGPETDDDELRLLLLDVVSNDGDVLEVECCVDFVEEVERRGTVVMKCEEEAE